MKRGTILTIFLLFLLVPIIYASSVDSEIQKLTYYAEEYETGNIDYIQLRVYMSSVKENLNEILGARGKEEGGILKQEQIEKVLGKPSRETKWVWVEREERETKLDYPVPQWEKIIFDGKKIQIKLEAFPSIFNKRDFDNNFTTEIKDGDLIYRLHFNVEFKKSEEQLNIGSKITEIKSLAETFNSDPSQSNAETLAEESVNVERVFEGQFRQNHLQCQELMVSIFGSENKRDDQQILLNEINFFEGEDFEAKIRLEMCDECGWNWINMNMWFEGRGKFKNPEIEYREISKEKFKGMSDEEFKSKAANLISEMQSSLERGDYNSALENSYELNALTNAWTEKANNLWEEMNEEFQLKTESMSDEERQKFDQNYGWIKQEQEKRQKVKELQEQNYENIKQFYLNLFSSYEKKEYYFTQSEFEKRLIEEFKTGGEEICNNNLDDNANEQVDCAESQCSGKICGRGTKIITKENSTETEEVDFYCIQNICQAKEEIITEKLPVCGNHICEEKEADIIKECSAQEICLPIFIEGSCQEDCTFETCPEYPPIECKGKVIFKGKDEKGCPLEPTCIEEITSCSSDDECEQPLCGISECIISDSENNKGTCQVVKLTECQEGCADGEKEIKKCESGKEIITQICIDGLWKKTEEDNACVVSFEPEPLLPPSEPRLMKECEVRSDCGGKNDVCSNGECVTIPEVIEIDSEQEFSEQVFESEENSVAESESTETQKTGRFIFGIFQTLISKTKTTGKEIENSGETIPTQETTPESNLENNNLPKSEEIFEEKINLPEPDNNCADKWKACGGPCSPCDYDQGSGNQEQWQDDSQQWEEREDAEREMREEEQKIRCEKDCERPCVENCIRESCGEKFDCNVDEESKKCEQTCSPESSCVDKCIAGENWWENKNEEHKEEKGVFAVGGSCRQEQQKTEGHIWFNGWGEPFEKIEPLKRKYYQGFNSEWCKNDLENLKKQRQEFEKGFNQEFAKWFFEDYLANSAENWEQATGGIYEVYWTNVDNLQQTAHRMDCLNIHEFSDYNLMNVKYESEYGNIEFWEELKIVKIPELDKEITMITPYMKIWVFPSKEFIKYEMKSSMEKGEFPGPQEEKTERENEEGPTEEEKELIKQDKRFIKEIQEISQKYNGNVDGLIQIKDFETNEVVFNLYVQINEEDIIKMKPMPPEQVPEEDIKIEIDFEKIYSLISMQEKEMRGEEIESPPWDKKQRRGFREIKNNAQMYFKILNIVNSAKVYPEEAKEDVKSLFNLFIKMSMQGDREDRNNNKERFEEGEDLNQIKDENFEEENLK